MNRKILLTILTLTTGCVTPTSQLLKGDPDIRNDALQKIPLMSEDEKKAILPQLIKGFRSYNMVVRYNAVEAACAMGPVAVPFLIYALGNKSDNMRRYAALALGCVGPEAAEALPELKAASQDKDFYVRSYAGDAAKKIELLRIRQVEHLDRFSQAKSAPAGKASQAKKKKQETPLEETAAETEPKSPEKTPEKPRKFRTFKTPLGKKPPMIASVPDVGDVDFSDPEQLGAVLRSEEAMAVFDTYAVLQGRLCRSRLRKLARARRNNAITLAQTIDLASRFNEPEGNVRVKLLINLSSGQIKAHVQLTNKRQSIMNMTAYFPKILYEDRALAYIRYGGISSLQPERIRKAELSINPEELTALPQERRLVSGGETGDLEFTYDRFVSLHNWVRPEEVTNALIDNENKVKVLMNPEGCEGCEIKLSLRPSESE